MKQLQKLLTQLIKIINKPISLIIVFLILIIAVVGVPLQLIDFSSDIDTDLTNATISDGVVSSFSSLVSDNVYIASSDTDGNDCFFSSNNKIVCGQSNSNEFSIVFYDSDATNRNVKTSFVDDNYIHSISCKELSNQNIACIYSKEVSDEDYLSYVICDSNGLNCNVFNNSIQIYFAGYSSSIVENSDLGISIVYTNASNFKAYSLFCDLNGLNCETTGPLSDSTLKSLVCFKHSNDNIVCGGYQQNNYLQVISFDYEGLSYSSVTGPSTSCYYPSCFEGVLGATICVCPDLNKGTSVVIPNSFIGYDSFIFSSLRLERPSCFMNDDENYICGFNTYESSKNKGAISICSNNFSECFLKYDFSTLYTQQEISCFEDDEGKIIFTSNSQSTYIIYDEYFQSTLQTKEITVEQFNRLTLSTTDSEDITYYYSLDGTTYTEIEPDTETTTETSTTYYIKAELPGTATAQISSIDVTTSYVAPDSTVPESSSLTVTNINLPAELNTAINTITQKVNNVPIIGRSLTGWNYIASKIASFFSKPFAFVLGFLGVQ